MIKMTAIGQSNHAFFFDGVSDSIIVPEGAFTSVGGKTPEGGNDVRKILSSQTSDTFTATTTSYETLTIEAWVMPDCGGTIIEKDNQFRLSLGNVDTPGPATFTVQMDGDVRTETHEVSTATEVAAGNRYEGTVYPISEFGGIHDYYNRFDTGTYGYATDLNRNHRELIHVVATVDSSKIRLYINGQLMVQKSIKDMNLRIAKSQSNVYIGGKGGQFRGVMEAVHINNRFTPSMVRGNCPLPNKGTQLLYRFEEPISPIKESYTFTNLTGGYDTGTLSTLTLTSAEAQTLAKSLTGKVTSTGTVDFTASPYSSGKYNVYDASTGSNVLRQPAHVPYNLLINPGSINPNTKKPNGKAPERVRLHSIDVDTGVLTISSIHIDESVDTNEGLMGVIHKTRDAGVDNHFVVIGADLLLDSKTGKAYQPPHYNTQIIDRTGQMVIDESGFDNHGLVFSNRLAIDSVDTKNPYAVSWPVDIVTGEPINEGWQLGHSGRHINNHVKGHSFLNILPNAVDEIVDQQTDGSADLVDLVYDQMQAGVEKQISVNSKVDIYRDLDAMEINDITNTATVTVAVNSYENTSSPPAGKKELIAIGGPDFDFTPFLLKGPAPLVSAQYDTDVRNHHLRPSKESRVALLHVPQLTSTSIKFSPYVEIHYNAIDLTGETMSQTVESGSLVTGTQYRIVSTGTTDFTNAGAADSNPGTIFTATGVGDSGGGGTARPYYPLLMVEKTVPAGSTPTSGGTYVYDAIVDALASGKTLYSAGGVIDASSVGVTQANLMSPHALLGDVSEGYSADTAIDDSLCPANYTPRADSTSVNKIPQVILESTSTTGTRDSVFNKMILNKVTNNKALSDKGLYERLDPDVVVGSPSAGEFDTGVTASSSHVHEVFDIIDNVEISTNVSNVRFVVQPSDRRRTNQLASIKTNLNTTNEVNTFNTMFLMSRARVRGIEETEGEGASYTTIRCVGIVDAATSRSVNFTGSGSPDSHVVKEIEPNSPVVTVTLGGPGQGAIDTKPVYQNSILAHESYSSRRAYALIGNKLEMNWNTKHGTLHVSPLNNDSDSLSSWGTYGFPKIGRIYLPDGSSAKYYNKTGTTFLFNLSDIGSNDYIGRRGEEYTNIGDLLNSVGVMKGPTTGFVTIVGNFTLYSEPDFGNDTDLENGSTVNDRMHQTLSDVQHDYQLGTQYASTRALAEIPVFSSQFFHDNVGPDNAFKIHVDATHTAHTYNPNPVGRRHKATAPADREAQSAYAFSIAQNKHVESATITRWESSQQRIHVSDPKIFPAASAAAPVGGVNQPRFRRVFTKEGEWAWYENDPNDSSTLGYLQIAQVDASNASDYSYSSGFISSLKAGIPLYVGGPVIGETIPIASDEFTPSSDFENRSEYYHDAASVKTQGGNVDYGLRQYVSAVEFKAGPESNPHASRISNKRATGRVVSAEELTLSGNPNDKLIILTMKQEDFSKFPNLGYASVAHIPSDEGALRYVVEYDDGTTVHEYNYHGNIEFIDENGLTSPENSIVLSYYDSVTTSYPVSLQGETITLAARKRIVNGNSIGTDNISRGDASFQSPLYRELMSSTHFIGTVPQTSASSTITVTTAAGKNLNDLHGANLKKGDVLYFQNATSIRLCGTVSKIASADATGAQVITLTGTCPATDGVRNLRVSMGQYEDKDAILNAKWLNPYAPGGLRHGDTVWANMSYNNPHAVEGLFAKSRGVYNEAHVWSEFNGGQASLSDSPRDSAPLENFLIGNTCRETAQNYVQHVNRTIEENYNSLGISNPPTVAYLDPYLSGDDHARVLLYDVAHDREFIAFQDIHMQVQSSPQTAQIGWPKDVYEAGATAIKETHQINAVYNGAAPSPWTTQIDVANGFPSQNPYIRSTQQSKFIESAYAHDLANRHTEDLLDSTTYTNLSTDLPTDGRLTAGARLYGKAHGHHVHTGYSYSGTDVGYHTGYGSTPRTRNEVALYKMADDMHSMTRIPVDDADQFTQALIKRRTAVAGRTLRDPSTMLDTPDGTRVIPAFLCLKGIRSTTLDLASHEESRLQNLPQWKDMDFVRRLTIDLGEVAKKDGVTNTLKGAEEIVRLINQHSALTARVATGSAHDPSPFWHIDNGDRGTHMGYVRAHIGREVEDLNGDKGFTVVIHSTVPGASGRNFCAWLDNSKGQMPYQPQFLVGHGGRWRNFWALPDEREGENMHPAPMPLNKHGRPFAPITTLQQYITTGESGESVKSVTEFDESNVMRAVSDSISGKSNNTVGVESLDIKGSSSSLTKGLKTGTGGIARINFGGLVASGVPGWSPIAGKWGYGKANDETLLNRYGNSDVTDGYTSHVPVKDIAPDKVGTAPIYGFRFKDNLGRESGIRMIYRKMGDEFSNDNTILPDTIEDEVCIFFDDRSVSDGGFTIGHHMNGEGDATGRSTMSTNVENRKGWFGNRWNGVSSPSVVTKMTLDYQTANETVEVTSIEAQGDASSTSFPVLNSQSGQKEDALSYLGYPRENGVFQASVNGAEIGNTFSYTKRVGNKFYGVSPTIADGDYLVSPVQNWTTIITDEVIAAATAAAINAGNEINDEDGHTFDCTKMYATDGRTFGEWGVKPDSIKIRAYNTSTSVKPLSSSFTASLHKDLGIKAAHLEFGEIEGAHLPEATHAQPNWFFGLNTFNTAFDPVLDERLDAGQSIACGYIPYNLLQIRTLAKGPNVNTATPILVDSNNRAVSTDTWRENLKGMRFTRTYGDHILPKIDNPMGVFDASQTSGANWATRQFKVTSTSRYNVLIPKSADTHSVGEKKRIYFRDDVYALVTQGNNFWEWDLNSQSENWPVGVNNVPTKDSIFSLYAKPEEARDFAGIRSVGSVFSEPIVYFRGGKSGEDHSVPLFFGGGFSGVVLDVNDGTANDYSSFYTHPYANGPTGVAGLQNASEISTSHAMLDCNAMFAFFPGAALCNQHRGNITPPAFNKNNILSPDLSNGTTYSSGVVKAKPVPLVIRFPHPTARYDDHLDGIDIDSKTTYMIFGPGQAFPFTREVQDDGDTGVDQSIGQSFDSSLGSNRFEPHPGRVVVVGNSWSSVPNSNLFPNSIGNSSNVLLPPVKTYYTSTAGWHWRAMVNWESPAGYTMKGKWSQRPAHGRHYGQQLFNDGSTGNTDTPYNATDLRPIHPKMHTPTIGFGITMAADTVWHMDGGYHPGGSWMDDQLTFNPPHAVKTTRITAATTKSGGGGSHWERANQIHPTAFRMSGVLTGKILQYIDGVPGQQSGTYTAETITTSDAKMDYIVVDATRCQNGEELATVLGAAINAFPGKGALKAIGGTHMPSMGNAMRQDRYGWINLGAVHEYDDDATTGNFIDTNFTDGTTTFTQTYLEQIPASGWLRAHDTSANKTSWACYHSREVINESASNWKVRFYLAPNRVYGQNKPEDPESYQDVNTTADFPTIDTDYDTLAVWSKAGVMRFNNENDSTRDHMTQVHFSGIADAIDRTKPVGAIGWHGERYSYLNSLKISTTVTKNAVNTTTTGYAAGLGAYHPMLAFSPYGTAGTVMGIHSNVPAVAPLYGSPESTPTIDGIGNALGTQIQKDNFYTKLNLITNSGTGWDSSVAYDFKDTDATGTNNQWNKPINYLSTVTLPDELVRPQGLYTNAFLVVSYESESALISMIDRDNVKALGDWLHMQGQNTNTKQYAGTTMWDYRIHGQDRFTAPANAGPNVEAMIVHDTAVPVGTTSSSNWAATTLNNQLGAEILHSTATSDLTHLFNATPGLNKTGDLVYDLDYSVGSVLLDDGTTAERSTSADYHTVEHTDDFPAPYWMGDVNAFQMYKDSAVKNFSVEHVVWKRMDGGNLSLPAVNARGLGAVPWVSRNGNLTGEKLLGNVRFSFETTNSAMMPILQAQELAHPELMRKHPYKIGNVLNIPNEEIQFQSINVRDDTGQMHKIEGGSPLGTIIRGFRVPEDTGTKGNAPALANSGNTPNLKVQLPNPNSIPGNIVVRSGFDPIQAYQTETMGAGGMQHPDLGASHTGHLFDNSVAGPRMSPTYEDHNWERINPVTFDSELGAWNNDAPLHTSYELHDRTLFFHVCKMGHSHTHRYPHVTTSLLGLSTAGGKVSSWDATNGNLKMNASIVTDVFDAGFGTKETSDNRRFIRLYDEDTDEGVVLSYLSIGNSGQEFKWFKSVVGDVDFASFLDKHFTLVGSEYVPIGTLKVVPSYYVPAGSTRFFAARRLRDHAEVSGNSPDMAHTQYFAGDTVLYNAFSKPKMTPMPYPRMGHHYVTPTMPMLPGHWAHPAYQSLYKRHLVSHAMENGFLDSAILSDNSDSKGKKADILSDTLSTRVNPLEAEVNFSGVNASPAQPSDIHGGAFTLMFETGVKYDGYGVLASSGANAGDINKAGGHTIVLEAAANYTLGKHFPDPKEVGAYQIVIQPNLFSSQIVGYHRNTTTQLTSQQVNTVIGIKESTANNIKGGLALVLAKATSADVRGCEVFINECMLDINPDYGSQFTNIPPLMAYNPLGVQLTESPSFTRRGFPYSVMFSDATPGYTLNIPWWSIMHKTKPDDNNGIYAKLSHYAPDNYYQLCRNTFGSIGKQLTINGYSSIYIDIYSNILQSTSIIPQSTVISFDSGSGRIQVSNSNLFPLKNYFSPVVEYTGKNGKKYSKPLIKRSGSDFDVNKGDYITVSGGSTAFWTNLYDGAVLRLSDAYNSLPTDELLVNKERSVFANILPQIVKGNDDTNSGYVPDAFLCLWHNNLGRPNTYYSDSRNTFDGNAIDKKQYNHLPEHFETIHYHDFSYAISNGPFDFKIQTPSSSPRDGTTTVGNQFHDAGGTNVMLSNFWPCGSRGGAQASDLGFYGYATASWNAHAHLVPANYDQHNPYEWIDGADAGSGGSYSATNGIATNPLDANARRSFGYRNAVLQASNRPRYGTLPARRFYESTANVEGANTIENDTGPLVQAASTDWVWGGNGTSTTTFPTTYVGIMERQTNFTGMLGHDRAEMQVRYSDGRRMTRPFGTPVRTIRNPSAVQRDWWGDDVCKGESSLSVAAQWYLVDWWGNERGEDVRRAPVRGFGIRPAWDCGDAYEYDRRHNRTPYRRIWNNGKPIYNLKGVANLTNGNVSVTTTIPRFGGTSNDENIHASNTDFDLVDVFAPTHALRVGDMGNGRGVRYPTAFNEDVLMELSSPVHKTGIVLSANTAEPLFGKGLLRPRNDVLQADEVKRGISARLGIDDNGLLKTDAVVSDRVESIVGDSPHKTAISRTSPRIGIDAEITEGEEQNHVVINTEAHSLHTDRNVGQRVTLLGASNMVSGVSSLTHADYTGIGFNRQNGGSPVNNVHKYSHTNMFRPYGGSYILESKNYAGYFDDSGWGYNNLTGAIQTSNPYQDLTWKTTGQRNNEKDSVVKFMIRPVRVLDNKHVEIYRHHDTVATGTPQYTQNYFRATAGGKYGIFTYEVSNGRTASTNLSTNRSLPDGNGPYLPIFAYKDNNTTFGLTDSRGPNIPGSEVTGYDNTKLTTTTSTLVITENTLQHHRSDAPRRRQEEETDEELSKMDYSVKPRYSQSLHNKGHKGDVSYNVTDHTGDGAS